KAPAGLRRAGGAAEARPPATPQPPPRLDQLVECRRVARPPPQRVPATLVRERRLSDLPALAEAADEVALLDTGARHEHLAELLVARHLLERSHVHARLTDVDEEARDPTMLGDARVGARQQQPPVGDGAVRRPDLLAVDLEMIALVFGARPEAGQIGTGVRLGVELTPQLVRREDLFEIALLLGLGAVMDDGRSHDADAEPVDGGRRV